MIFFIRFSKWYSSPSCFLLIKSEFLRCSGERFLLKKGYHRDKLAFLISLPLWIMHHWSIPANSNVSLRIEVNDLVDSFVFSSVPVYHVMAKFSVFLSDSCDSCLRYLLIVRLVLEVRFLVVLFRFVGSLECCLIAAEINLLSRHEWDSAFLHRAVSVSELMGVNRMVGD